MEREILPKKLLLSTKISVEDDTNGCYTIHVGLGTALKKAVVRLKKQSCPSCARFSEKGDCPLFEMCVISLSSLKKQIPLHFRAR